MNDGDEEKHPNGQKTSSEAGGRALLKYDKLLSFSSGRHIHCEQGGTL
jgi:hypothetical protein